jgi:CRP/FNR family transcriptional regulator, dissimilatory nitrate respiration regulator
VRPGFPSKSASFTNDCDAAALPRCSSLSAVDWIPNEITATARQRTLQAGESLFRQGDQTYGIFAIVKGRVQMIRYDSHGRALVLFTGAEGELFAEAALFSETYHCDAMAATEATVRIYPRPILLSLLRRDPTAAQKFIALLAREVMSLRTRLEVLNIRSASERVLRHLFTAAGSDGRTVEISGTLKEMASELGLAHEVLYRTLADLETQGLIERADHLIKLKYTI